MAVVAASNKKTPAEIRIPQARDQVEEAALLFQKAEVMDWYHQCIAKSWEFEAFLFKDEEERRKDRLSALTKSAAEWKKAAEHATGQRKRYLLRESEFAEVRALKLDGIELMHDLKVDEAMNRFQKALELERKRNSTDGTLWAEAALLEANALRIASNIIDRSSAMTDDETTAELHKIVDLFDGAVSSYRKMKNPDTSSLNFCLAMKSLYGVIIHKNPEAWEEWWIWRSVLPSGVFSSGGGSKRSQVRNVYLMIARSLMPLLKQNQPMRIKEEVIAKLMTLEEDLSRTYAVLRKKIPEAKQDSKDKLALGSLFDRIRKHLRVTEPQMLSDAYYKIWLPAKHKDVKVSVEEEEKALQKAGDSLADKTFDEAVRKYLVTVESKLKGL